MYKSLACNHYCLKVQLVSNDPTLLLTPISNATLKYPPTQSHLSSVVRGWDLLLLGRVCVCVGGGTKGFNRSSCDVMEWVQELVHCEGGLDRVEFG